MNNYQGEFMDGFSENKFSDGKFSSSMADLSAELKHVSLKCIKCNLCIKECEFLKRYGKPGEIADNFDHDKNPGLSMAFECSLCRLCAAVCPVDIDPSDMFLEIRRAATAQGNGQFDEHKGILAYERRGISKRYTWYGLPEGCDTVFFPGCNLPGTRPRKTLALFERLRQGKPSMGIVLDCCTNISHDLGRQDFFLSRFHEMRRFLVQNGVKSVIVACPSCYKIFDRYSEGLSVKSVYELLAEENLDGVADTGETVTIHDPCALRFNKGVQDAVRKIINGLGITVTEMPHSGPATFCCGEGGSVKYLSPDLSKKWAIARSRETGDNRVITYCAGCVNCLGKTMPASHVLDLIFEPEATLSGNVKVSRAPMTYWNRIWLKSRLKKTLETAVNFERRQISK
jgi:Fe-S oxidoreductase